MKKILIVILILILPLAVFAKKFKICPNGHLNEPGYKYCIYCGLPLTEVDFIKQKTEDNRNLVCPKGHDIIKGSRFCPICGSALVPAAKQNIKKMDYYYDENSCTKLELPDSLKSDGKKITVIEHENSEADFNSFMKTATAAFNEGNYRYAKLQLRQAMNIKPDDTELLYNIGVIEYKLRNFQDSEYYFRKILSKNKEDLQSLLYLGLIDYRTFNNTKAIENWEKILKKASPESSEYKLAKQYLAKLNSF